MSNVPKVTVIIPVYNVERYLERCLDSLIAQSYSNYDVICIDDCSTDNSLVTLRKYETHFPNQIKVFTNNKNMGVGNARERGLASTSSEYVLFVDSDDYILPDYIDQYVAAAADTPCDIVVGGYVRDVDGRYTKHLVSNSVWSIVTYPLVATKMFRTKFLKENDIGFTRISCGEDIFFSLACYYFNAQYTVIPYAGYYYYLNRKSITGSMNYKKNPERVIAEVFSTFLHMYHFELLPQDKQYVIEYAYLANMINALATLNRGANMKRMRKKYDFVMNDLERHFPDAFDNPLIGFFRPKGQTRKIRLSVGGMSLLHRLHLDGAAFSALALLSK